MENLLNTENLIELHDKLNEFATYHENKGGQKAHQLIKKIWDELRTAIMLKFTAKEKKITSPKLIKQLLKYGLLLPKIKNNS